MPFSAGFSSEVNIVEAALPLHLGLKVGQLGDRHVDVAAADVRRMSEVRGDADHAPVYPEPLMRPAVVLSPGGIPGRPRCQAAGEALHPELAVAGHVAVSFLSSTMMSSYRSSIFSSFASSF